jgi:cis-3-alkyl-4-acyloxetan-2-one decarboxylase
MHKLPPPPMPAWIEQMLPGFERYLVDVGGARMHVMEQGEGLPVIMLHGNPTWGFLYRKVAAALCAQGKPGAENKEGLRIILPDLVGLGFSDKPAMAAHSLKAHAQWFGNLVDGLGLKRFVFVGQDWGGPIGIRALAERAERVAGLVLLNTVVGPPRPGFRPTAFHRLSQMPMVSDVLFRRLGFPQNALAFSQGDWRSIRGQVSRAYTLPLKGHARNAAPLALARMVPDSLAHPSVAQLRICQDYIERYTGPAAIVWGQRDPILGRVLGRMQGLLPHASVRRTQAGHFLQEEVPDEIAAAVREVIASAEHGGSGA